MFDLYIINTNFLTTYIFWSHLISFKCSIYFWCDCFYQSFFPLKGWTTKRALHLVSKWLSFVTPNVIKQVDNLHLINYMCEMFTQKQNIATLSSDPKLAIHKINCSFMHILHNFYLNCWNCSHNQTSQKRHQTTRKNNQNWRNIYPILPFKTMAIMASCSFFIHMNVKEFKPKIHLIKFLT